MGSWEVPSRGEQSKRGRRECKEVKHPNSFGWCGSLPPGSVTEGASTGQTRPQQGLQLCRGLEETPERLPGRSGRGVPACQADNKVTVPIPIFVPVLHRFNVTVTMKDTAFNHTQTNHCNHRVLGCFFSAFYWDKQPQRGPFWRGRDSS